MVSNAPVDLSSEAIKQTAALFRDHLYHFSNFFMRDLPDHNFQVPTRMNRIVSDIPKFQVRIFDLLDHITDFKRLALASPRGFLKSTTCSVFFPLQCAMFKKFHEILLVSNSEALAIHLMRQIRTNVETNDLLRTMFGKMESDKWTETHMIFRNGVSIRGCGWGAQIRGFRPDLIILDDIENDETVASEDLRRKIREWLTKAAVNALSTDGCMLFIGTIISRLSLLFDYIHHPPEGWKSVFNQAYIDNVQEPGHELWPEEKPHDWLQRRKAEIGSWAFASEFLNDPLPTEGNRFSPNFFKYFTDSDLEGRSLGEYVAIDPSFSDSPTACYGVVMNILHDNEDRAYIDTFYKRKATSGELIKYFKSMYRQRRARIRKVGVEANGPQKGFFDRLREECHNEGLYPPFVELMNRVNGKTTKDDRITYGIQPRLEAGKLLWRRGMDDLEADLLGFPEIKYKDLLDCLSYSISLIEPMMDYSESQFPTEYESEPVLVRGVTGYGDDYAL